MASGGRCMTELIRRRQPAHGELHHIVGQLAPVLDLGHVGRLGIAAEQVARLGARRLAREREGVAPERVGVSLSCSDTLRRPTGDVGRNAGATHARNVRRPVQQSQRGAALRVAARYRRCIDR